MMKYGMVVAMVAGGLAAGYAVADDESDARARQELIEDIDEKVEDVGEELAGFEADADVGDLDDALSYAREVAELVSKLDAVKGDDGRARAIVTQYPGYLEAFREAAVAQEAQGRPASRRRGRRSLRWRRRRSPDVDPQLRRQP